MLGIKIWKRIVTVATGLVVASGFAAFSACDGGGKVAGKGTSDDPYQIETVEDFKEITSLTIETEKPHFVLMNDIDLSGEKSNDVQISNSFKGVFDGQNHRIYNYEGYQGLFSYNEGTIKNLIVGGTVAGEYSVTHSVDQTTNTNGLTVYLGGLVDVNAGNLINCGAENVQVSLSLNNQVKTEKELNAITGGLVGISQGGNMQYCYAKNCAVSVKANIDPGDLVSDGKAGARAGGVVGMTDTASLLQNCYAYGNTVNAWARGGKTLSLTPAELRAFAGGLVGDSCSTNTKCLLAYNCDVSATTEEVDLSQAREYPHAGAVIGAASQGGSCAYTLETDKCAVIGKDYGSFTEVGRLADLQAAIDNATLTAGIAKWIIDESGNVAFDNFLHNPLTIKE